MTKEMIGKAATILATLAMTACAPTLAGQLASAKGEFRSSPDARVNVTSLDHGDGEPRVMTLEVGADGNFSTRESLPAGSYLVEAVVPGYAVQSKTVQLGDEAPIEMTLTPVAPVKAKTTRAHAELDQSRGSGDAMLMPPSL